MTPRTPTGRLLLAFQPKLRQNILAIEAEAAALDVERLAAIRDLLANYLWNGDDSGDENDLIAAYDYLRDVLGPSTEESIGATLTAQPGRAGRSE